IKIYARMLSIQASLEKIVSSAPPFQISTELHKSLKAYTGAVFFSSKLAAYKGSIVVNHVLDLVKHRLPGLGVPVGLEHNPADWHKVKSEVQDILTQVRGGAKKMSSNDEDPALHIPIFELTQKLLKGTGCAVTVPVMARVALMRNVLAKHPEENYWDKVDARLAQLQRKTPDQVIRSAHHTNRTVSPC
ncbi:hypothetical protein BD413DRAFT_464822, partial [Trametes elegans]